MLEKDIEQKYCKEVKKKGGICIKLVSPGNRGVPDRIALYPGGIVEFIEFKKPGGRLSELQKDWGERLERMGFKWSVSGLETIRKK